MTNLANIDLDSNSDRTIGLTVAVLVVAWAGIVAGLAQTGAFIVPTGALPVAIPLAVAIPPILFLTGYRFITALRTLVLTRDPALVAGAQTWRVIGIVFLVVWGLGDLPAVFAFPAGIGDILIGMAALPVALAIARRTPGWHRASRWLIAAGIADFTLAFATAIPSGSGGLLHFAGAPVSDLVQTLPVSMIPTFGVPLFLNLHIMSWLQLRRIAE